MATQSTDKSRKMSLRINGVKSMRVAFIFPNTIRNSGCRFRALQYMPYLKRKGIEYKLFFPRTYRMTGLRQIERAKMALYFPLNLVKLLVSILIGKYDVIFIQRYVFSAVLPVELCFRLFFRKKIVIDFDDLIYLKYPKLYSLVIRTADQVIVGNSFLSEFAKRYHSYVSIIPTPVETGLYYPAKSNKEKVFTLGWIGGPSGLYLLEPLYNAFQKLASMIDYRLVIVSDFTRGRKLSIPGVNVINQQWSEENELADLNSFDVGLMPLLKDDPLSKGKCSYKALQYMAVGTPAVIFAEGNNLDVIEDGKDGFLYKTQDEFISKVLTLYNNDNLSKRIGLQALEKIEGKYATSEVFKVFLKTISH